MAQRRPNADRMEVNGSESLITTPQEPEIRPFVQAPPEDHSHF
jgi:hypothetical protein